MWQEFDNLTNELALLEIFFDSYTNNGPKRRLSVFEALSSGSNSENSMSRTSSNVSLSSFAEFYPKNERVEPEKLCENIFSADDFKDCLSSDAVVQKDTTKKSVSKNRRKNKGMKESSNKKRKFRKSTDDTLSENIANQLFFDHSTKYSLVLTKKLESMELNQ